MDRLVFTAMASLKQLNNMKLKYANALANASTVGFKQTFQFATETSQVAGPGFGTRYVPMNRSNDELVIDQGPLIATGRKLDIYLKGGTLLGAQAPNGQVAFTRRGDLLVDQSGLLSTANGHVVLGEGGGPITVPVGVELAITNDGTVTATVLFNRTHHRLLSGTFYCVMRQESAWCVERTVSMSRLLREVRAAILRVGQIFQRYSPARLRALQLMSQSNSLVSWICLGLSKLRSR